MCTVYLSISPRSQLGTFIVGLFVVFFSSSLVVAETGWFSFQNGGLNTSAKAMEVKQTVQLEKKWSIELEGYGQSSPVVWRNTLYTTAVRGDNKEECIVAAHDLVSGKKKWSLTFKNPAPRESTYYVSKAAPTPVVDSHGIVSLFEGGLLVAVSHDGKVTWRRDLLDEFGELNSNHGLSSSLEHNDESVFVWIERKESPYIISVNKKSGKDNWKASGVGGTSWATPRLLNVGESQHLLLSGSGHIIGLDPSTGKRLWDFTGIDGNTVPTPMPLRDGEFLIGATTGRGEGGGGNPAAFNGVIKVGLVGERWSADYLWRCEKATSSFGSPVVMNGLAYFVNRSGVLFVVDANKGHDVYSQRLVSSMWATPVKLGNALILPFKNGTLQVIAEGNEFNSLGEIKLWEDGATEGQRGSFGGPVLYAIILIEDAVIARRGDQLINIQIK